MIVELVKSPFWYLFKPRKIVWSDQGRRGLHKGGENCLKYLIRGWSKKEGRGKKDLKKVGGRLGERVGALCIFKCSYMNSDMVKLYHYNNFN